MNRVQGHPQYTASLEEVNHIIYENLSPKEILKEKIKLKHFFRIK